MKKTLTQKTSEKIMRNKKIYKRYAQLFKEGSQITAVCETICIEMGIKFGTVYRVIKCINKS